MTEFKRHCKIFDKFILLLKRRGMGYTSAINASGEIELSFWYIGTNYAEQGCMVWNNTNYSGYREAFYEAYETAISMLNKV